MTLSRTISKGLSGHATFVSVALVALAYGGVVPNQQQIPAAPLPEQHAVPVILHKGVQWTTRQASTVGYVWAAEVTNPNDASIVTLVILRLHDAAGVTLFEDQREVVLAPRGAVEFTRQGEVPEAIATRGDHWSFDVAIQHPATPPTEAVENSPSFHTGGAIAASPTPPVNFDSARIANDVLPGVVFIAGHSADARQSQGSGFLVSADGTLITSLHVVSGMSAVGVQLADGERYDAVQVLAVDPRRDLVILKIPGFGLPHAVLGDSNDVAIGEGVLAIGSPLGLSSTVTSGIISSIREHPAGFQVLQTDAAANPGNSGGPLVNAKGEVIGVIGFKLAGAENLNFAMPINYVRGMLSSALEPMSLQEMNNVVTTAGDAFAPVATFPIRIPIKHRHFASFQHAILTLYANRIEFDETSSSDHDFTVSIDEVAQLNTSSINSLMGNASYTLHFGRDTKAGDRISFEVDLASLRTLVEFVVAYCPNAVINR
jgi:S1-C subfamily serine protease